MRFAPLLAAAISLLAATAVAGTIAGTVQDPLGEGAAGARLTLRTGEGAVVATVQSDRDGRFSMDAIDRGRYELVADLPGLEPARRMVAVPADGLVEVEVQLALARLTSEVTVAAEPGRAGDVSLGSQSVNVLSQRTVADRARTVVAEAVETEPGVQLQRTAPGIAGIYVRGLGGRNVSVFADGVRFSTESQRGGINTFLSLIDPGSLRGAEVLRGAQGAAYGGASLGGSLHLFTRTPALAASGTEVRGRTTLQASSYDQGYRVAQEAEWAGERAAILVALHGQRANPLRPGDGRDAHAAVTRFLGLPSSIIGGNRLPDTGLTSYGGVARVEWSPAAGRHLSLSYRRGQLDGVRRYDQLLGGDGDLLGDVRGLRLDLASVRYEASGLGWLDSLSLTGSFNSQREERVRQGGHGDPTRKIEHEGERTTALGVQLRGRRALGPLEDVTVGAEVYRERVDAAAHSRDPEASSTAVFRPRIPDGARYLSADVWTHATLPLAGDRLRLTGALRLSHAGYEVRAASSPLVDGSPLWTDSDLDVSDLTFRAGATWQAHRALRLTAALSRGFRAPSMTDLGTLGLTGSGFEVGSRDVSDLGLTSPAWVGTTSDESAVASTQPVRELEAESSRTVEAHAHVNLGPIAVSLGGFVNDIEGAVEKLTLILPPGAVGLRLGGEPVTAQLDSGAVLVARSSDPVLVRANASDVRLWGIEQSLEVGVTPAVRLQQGFTFVRAEDRTAGGAPSLSGGTPAPDGFVRLLHEPPAGRHWLTATLRGVLRQDRLSTLALNDRRIGAFRNRDDIAAFFRGGASARGLVEPGPDGHAGTGDDRLAATGETLAEVQDRVLGVGIDGAPLFATLPGYVVVDVAAGYRLTPRMELAVDLLNLGDQSYRGMAWGVPGPGRGVRVRFSSDF